jgi:hypothetical protein
MLVILAVNVNLRQDPKIEIYYLLHLLRPAELQEVRWVEEPEALLLEVVGTKPLACSLSIRFELPKWRKYLELLPGSKTVFFLAMQDGRQLASNPFLGIIPSEVPPPLSPLPTFLSLIF